MQFKNQLKYLIPIACRDVMEHIENEPNEFNKSLTALQQAYHTSIRQTKIKFHIFVHISLLPMHPTPPQVLPGTKYCVIVAKILAVIVQIFS